MYSYCRYCRWRWNDGGLMLTEAGLLFKIVGVQAKVSR